MNDIIELLQACILLFSGTCGGQLAAGLFFGGIGSFLYWQKVNKKIINNYEARVKVLEKKVTADAKTINQLLTDVRKLEESFRNHLQEQVKQSD